MSAESLADKILAVGRGNSMTGRSLRELIIAAIRQAVAEERESCLLITKISPPYLPHDTARHYAWSDACDCIATAIRARET